MSRPVSIKGLIQAARGVFLPLTRERTYTHVLSSAQAPEEPKKRCGLLFLLTAKEQYLELVCKLRLRSGGAQ